MEKDFDIPNAKVYETLVKDNDWFSVKSKLPALHSIIYW